MPGDDKICHISCQKKNCRGLKQDRLIVRYASKCEIKKEI